MKSVANSMVKIVDLGKDYQDDYERTREEINTEKNQLSCRKNRKIHKTSTNLNVMYDSVDIRFDLLDKLENLVLLSEMLVFYASISVQNVFVSRKLLLFYIDYPSFFIILEQTKLIELSFQNDL